MKVIKDNYVRFCPVIGLGYWKDIYKAEECGMDGVSHNIILPFVRLQFGFLLLPPTK